VQRAEQPAGYFAAIREGLHFIASDRLMRAILPRSIVVNFLASPLFAVVLPVFAERTYGSALDFGAMIAGFGAGSVAGSIAYGAIAHRLSKRTATIAGFILGGSPFWLLIFEPPLAVSVGLIVFCGLSLAPLNPIFGTVLLQRTPDELRGRVLGATAAIATLCAPLGILVFGFALDWLGLSATLIAISAGMMLVGIHLAREAAIRELDAPSG
jgi:predicted MFS family arabinose efflux permease